MIIESYKASAENTIADDVARNTGHCLCKELVIEEKSGDEKELRRSYKKSTKGR